MLEPDTDQQDRKNLAETLQQLRKAVGLSGERLAARAAMSQSKVSRIESGRALPSVADVECLLQALEVPSDARAEILSLARAANVEYASVRSSARKGIWRRQAELKSLAKASSVVRHFLPAIPSGLLQTREYARAVLTPGVEGRPARDIDRAIQARLDRQEVLNDESRRFYFLLTEQAARVKYAAADVMAAQLRHMTEASTRPNVDLAILPNSALVSEPPLNVFAVYDDRLVTVELFSGSVALRDYRDISYHLNVFEHFRERAVTGDQARDFLESVADEFTQQRA
ncbi:helix-turn-helix domain-containing protein [Saccharopolyspora phatthalungensis]|uniref:Transcriptional regulator with XRE-family HTH domain n=1 Tax=Saccharopolyspora phatthalungensis TaxID=664693 RepID=A0A840QCW9_9PSEU|nr:helix-turn-helix transcriptional regulator [Saccharopolyspora phatthalungensis]MBB5158594.1 transcriptional regulator with XRE-family HTH domain [Saccharopolyspora phatthalungensis]